MENHVTSRKLRNGGYYAIHKWLVKHYGKANHCENENCSGKSKSYQWALKKGCTYEHKKENFIQLCASCHRLYDQKQDWIDRMKKTKTGTVLSEEHKNKIRLSMLKHDRHGSNNPYWRGGPPYVR